MTTIRENFPGRCPACGQHVPMARLPMSSTGAGNEWHGTCVGGHLVELRATKVRDEAAPPPKIGIGATKLARRKR